MLTGLSCICDRRKCDVSERFAPADSRSVPVSGSGDDGDKPCEAAGLAVLLPSARVGMFHVPQAVLVVTFSTGGRHGSNLCNGQTVRADWRSDCGSGGRDTLLSRSL